MKEIKRRKIKQIIKQKWKDNKYIKNGKRERQRYTSRQTKRKT